MKTGEIKRGHFYRLKINGTPETVRILEVTGSIAKVTDRRRKEWMCGVEQLEPVQGDA